MRTLAIGDIHGCLAALVRIWEIVAPEQGDRIVFLGDYIDRGPDSKGVIDFLIGLEDRTFDLTFLTGNHEEKMALARYGGGELDHWLASWGGQETLASYGPSGLEDVPARHWEFLRTLRPWRETDSHIFVHANLEPDVPLDQQTPFTLIHKKLGTPEPHMSGKVVICGHTAQASHQPMDLGHVVCIDTDPGRGGWLTCLDVDTGAYWQANVMGEVRRGAL